MWRRIFRPDVLFLVGSLQGVFPYALFLTDSVPDTITSMLSYYPLVMWAIGYLCFWAGTFLVRRHGPAGAHHETRLSFRALKRAMGSLCVLSLLEMVGLTKLYGGVPLLMFASGAASVNDTNNAEAASGFGQVGAALLTLHLLVSVLVVFLVKARQTRQSRGMVLRWLGLVGPIAFLLCVFNGKRQGLFMYAVIVAVASTLSLGSPVEVFRASGKQRAGKWRTVLTVAVCALLALPVISGFANLRNNGRTTNSGWEELEAYYLFPTVNMSRQCIEAGGFGPANFNPVGALAALLPKKLLSPDLDYTAIPKVEPTSPSGFYERLQWFTGLWGVVVFTFFCGACSQWMYDLAPRSSAALLTYGFIAWALFSAPIYNHFLNPLFLPVPAIVFWMASACYGEVSGLLQASRHAKEVRSLHMSV